MCRPDDFPPYEQQCLLCGGVCQRVDTHIQSDFGWALDEEDERPAIERYGTPEHEAWLIEMEEREG